MKIDMHVHTHLSSDSRMTLSAAVSAAKRKGLDGIAVADHNVFSPPPDIDDFIIIPACEYSTDAGHLLVYFLSSALDDGLTRDEKGRFHWRDIVSRAHLQNALVFLAHPYAPAHDVPEIFSHIDGIEAYNARIEHSGAKRANPAAQRKSCESGLPYSAGSDAHFPAEVGAAYWEYDHTDKSMAEIRNALINRYGRIYGGTAKAFWRPLSSWISTFSQKKYRSIPKTILRTAKAAAQSMMPNKKPVLIDMKGDRNNDPV